MGFSITWVAFKDILLAEAALAFGLVQSGQSDAMFDYATNGARIGDWSVVIFNDVRMDLADNKAIVRLSAGRDVVVVHVIESTMLQWAEQWRNGQQVWSLRHTSEEGPRHLDAVGDLPVGFEENKRRRFAEQDAEDAGANEVDFISEIPLDAAEQLTGFRHDTTEAEFFELVQPGGESRKPGFLGGLKSLFGR